MSGSAGSGRDEAGGREEDADPQNRLTTPPVQAGDGWLVGALSAEDWRSAELPGQNDRHRADRPSDDVALENEVSEAAADDAVRDGTGDDGAGDDGAGDDGAGDDGAGDDGAGDEGVGDDGTGDHGASDAPATARPSSTDPGPTRGLEVPQERHGSEQLREGEIVRARPQGGLRGVLNRLTGGQLNPATSLAERHRDEQVQRIRRPLHEAHTIAVSSIKGGVGKTTVVACLGLVLAEYRGDRVIALDAHPKAGTLADRLSGEPKATVRDLLAVIDSVQSLADVSRYTSLVRRLQVLASEQDPAASDVLGRDEYHRVCALLARFCDIVISDTGPGLVHPATEAALALADGLVIAGVSTADGAGQVDKTLDWLVVRGHAERVADAVVVLSLDRSKHGDSDEVRRHFTGRVRAVVEVPFDPHLATGARIELDRLRPATHDAFLALAAHLADRFRPPAAPISPMTTLGSSP